MRLRHVALVLLSAGACVAPQRPTPTDAAPPSPLARAALAEWEAWGSIVVVGWPEARPAETAATPERFVRLVEYWTAIPGGAGVAHQLLSERSAITAALTKQGSTEAPNGDGPVSVVPVTTPVLEDISLYAYPAWSAAFISATARRAGISESDLPSAARHARYLDAVLARAIANPEGARFRPYAPGEWAPRPGDLLCADRSAAPLAHWSMRLMEVGRPRPMHCDIVVRNGPGVVETVGGNVQDLVVLRRLPADGDGRVLPAPPGQPPLVLILASQEPG
jgi:Uncharacterized protein conserved in bacteria (DUF2272)